MKLEIKIVGDVGREAIDSLKDFIKIAKNRPEAHTSSNIAQEALRVGEIDVALSRAEMVQASRNNKSTTIVKGF